METNPEGFSLVCLDWNMPNMNGLDFSHPHPRQRTLEIPPRYHARTEGSRDATIMAYMTKPFFEKDLANKMLDCLSMGFE